MKPRPTCGRPAPKEAPANLIPPQRDLVIRAAVEVAEAVPVHSLLRGCPEVGHVQRGIQAPAWEVAKDWIHEEIQVPKESVQSERVRHVVMCGYVALGYNSKGPNYLWPSYNQLAWQNCMAGT